MDLETAIILLIIAVVGGLATWRDPSAAGGIISDLIAKLTRRKPK
jgi:hypothetical protein